MQEQTRERLRWGLWTAGWVGALVWMSRTSLAPAVLRGGRLEEVSATQPAYARISWDYGIGARPISIIFDVTLDNQATGSVTTDGEAMEAEIPLIGFATAGTYTIDASATYRVFGLARTRAYRFSGTVAA
ncbi:MAG: hypothetical protein HC822_05450 [Oscillochloris sp.]|nr:hypothetical protein [Oscillochloris sp.]